MHLLFIFLLVCCCFGSKSYLYNIFINLSCVLTRSTNSIYSHNYKYVHFTSLKVHPHNLRSLYLHLVPYPFISSVHFERVWVCVVMPICVHVSVCPLFLPNEAFRKACPVRLIICTFVSARFSYFLQICMYVIMHSPGGTFSRGQPTSPTTSFSPSQALGKKKHEKDDHRLAQKFNLELRDEMYAAHLP